VIAHTATTNAIKELRALQWGSIYRNWACD
jgi:hypothetical protein